MSKLIYPSRYSNGKCVSAAQYITELIFENKAKCDRVDLHFKFWTKPEWSKYYRNQIGSANKLLEKFSPKSIIKALCDKRAEKIYSLRAPHLLAIIEQYEKIISSENTDFTKTVDRKDETKYRQDQKKSSIISKLKELDNGS
jgi:hypothetical protein